MCRAVLGDCYQPVQSDAPCSVRTELENTQLASTLELTVSLRCEENPHTLSIRSMCYDSGVGKIEFGFVLIHRNHGHEITFNKQYHRILRIKFLIIVAKIY